MGIRKKRGRRRRSNGGELFALVVGVVLEVLRCDGSVYLYYVF